MKKTFVVTVSGAWWYGKKCRIYLHTNGEWMLRKYSMRDSPVAVLSVENQYRLWEARKNNDDEVDLEL